METVIHNVVRVNCNVAFVNDCGFYDIPSVLPNYILNLNLVDSFPHTRLLDIIS